MREETTMSVAESTLRARRQAVVQEHIVAENSGDLDAMIASFHRPRYDVVPIGAVSEEEAAVRELVGGLVSAFADFRFQALETHHAERAVIMEGRMTGTHRAPGRESSRRAARWTSASRASSISTATDW